MVKKTVKKVSVPKKTVVKQEKPLKPKVSEKDDKALLLSLKKERNGLIKGIVDSGLLTNDQLKRGGSFVRVKHLQEKCWEPVIDKINEIGRKIGEAPIGLGILRR